jgi:heme O synthase-like polyprenyltransferase
MALLPAALWPLLSAGISGGAGVTYAILATTLTLWQLTIAVRFLAERSDWSARRLLRASLLYLPLMLIIFLFLPR